MAIRKQDIADMVDRMPAFPKSVHRVLELTSDINSSPRDLVDVIEHDPVLIIKILKLVNSPYFGLAQKITSVNHAIVYIGLNTIKNLALSTATIGTLPRKNEAGFDMDAFLLHSLSTASIARLFARKLKIPERDAFDYFMSGLLHDFGKIVFAHFMPREFHKALAIAKEKSMPLYLAEKEIFDTDHTEIGQLLGGKWQLPTTLVEALQLHHCTDCERSLMTNVVSASDQISKELKIGYSGENIVGQLPGDIVRLFGPDITTVAGLLGDIQAEIEKASAFIAV